MSPQSPWFMPVAVMPVSTDRPDSTFMFGGRSPGALMPLTVPATVALFRVRSAGVPPRLIVRLTVLGPAFSAPLVTVPLPSWPVGRPMLTTVASARNHQSVGLPAVGKVPFAGSGRAVDDAEAEPAGVLAREVREAEELREHVDRAVADVGS